MQIITLAQFVKDFIAHIDKNILTISENELDTLINAIHDEHDILQQLLTEVEKKRSYCLQNQNQYDYTAFKPMILYATLVIMLVGILYYIIVHYYRPLYQEFTALAKELESFGITVIRNKTEEEITLVAETAKQFNPTEAVIIKDIIDRIYSINAKLHNNIVEWSKTIITIFIALLIQPTYNRIYNFFWPQYKKRYGKYGLIEQKLHNMIRNSKHG